MIRPGLRAAVWGALIALIVVAIGGGLAYAYLSRKGMLSKVSEPQTVVVVLAAPDEDGVEVAQGIAVLHVASQTWAFVDPSTNVTVSGTSFTRLRDAYPFGGGGTVAEALASKQRLGTYGWVEIPYSGWQELIGGQDTSVDLPGPINVFNGSEVLSFPEGTQTVPAKDIAPLLNGAQYLPEGGRGEVVRQFTQAAIERLSSASGLPYGSRTNLAPTALPVLRARP